jgi:hypothetical protein
LDVLKDESPVPVTMPRGFVFFTGTAKSPSDDGKVSGWRRLGEEWGGSAGESVQARGASKKMADRIVRLGEVSALSFALTAVLPIL